MTTYPKRLIEVDLPMARISAHARREKSIRHGHISTLHIWWARRPLAACRAVLCSSLWPDPVDLAAWARRGDAVQAGATVIRPQRFLLEARAQMTEWAGSHLAKASPDSLPSMLRAHKDSAYLDDPLALRQLLLDFIADFADWDNSADPDYLVVARDLTHAAHMTLGGETESRPLVVDPYAGGGSIPLEALRVGADTYASDLNPVAALINKVVLEYVPNNSQSLAGEVAKWGLWVKWEALRELADFYPEDPDGATPIAYLWARTIKCEGPECGVTVPLLKSSWIAKKPNRKVHYAFAFDSSRGSLDISIVEADSGEAAPAGTVNRGNVTCPACGFTTPAQHVRDQLRKRRGGARDSMLLTVVLAHPTLGTVYRRAGASDVEVARKASSALASPSCSANATRLLEESTPSASSHRSVASLALYGIRQWADIYNDRQLLALAVISECVNRAAAQGMSPEAQTVLALAVSKVSDYLSTLCRWRTSRSCAAHTFCRQALPIVWDYAEMNPFAGSSGDWEESIRYLGLLLQAVAAGSAHAGSTATADAAHHPLPTDAAQLLFTDPPYYDSVSYADLSDHAYVWLKRCVPSELAPLFATELTPKDREAVVYHPHSKSERLRYENLMREGLTEGCRIVAPSGCGVIVFAHKSTAGWEAMLQAVVDSGWTVTASWPIDTEAGGRINAIGTAALASSIHLVCRPRENPDGSRLDEVGEWRDVLAELPTRIHEWMPRLASEGVVGADAIFACLGPALEVFSRYSRVEKSSGEVVGLREYLEQVWAAVSQEALSMIFDDPETAGLEPDARLTAMWLWTLGAGEASSEPAAAAADDDLDNAEPIGKLPSPVGSYTLEFDAARKIAQGLGIHLEKSPSVVEVKADKARLLPVAERTRYLFGKDVPGGETAKKPKKVAQMDLFAELLENDAGMPSPTPEMAAPEVGATVLDRVHQAMILFGAGRGEALKRFLVEDGIGKQATFWKLAQALSALYPIGSDEKRWVDGVLARKKGLGL